MLSPVYQRFVALEELLIRLNRVRDSYIVLREIYTLHKGEPDSVATSIGFALTVTLGRIRRYEEMSEVSKTMIVSTIMAWVASWKLWDAEKLHKS